jgi:protein FRG1
MSSDGYAISKGGKLKLKGESSSGKSKSKKNSKKRKLDDTKVDVKLEDELNHAGGWVIEEYEQITGTVFIEFKEYMYMHGLDNGLFVIGAPHQPAERPETCELLTAIRIDDKSIALKSAYGKYLSVNQNGLVIGRSEAVSSNEYFKVEFDYDYDGRKVYLKASNDKYVSMSNDGDIVAILDAKTDDAQVSIRSLMTKSDKNSKAKKELPEEEQTDDLRNVELNYVMKYQKFQDKKVKLSKDDSEELREAKDTGILHEKLLDRREKMKADRYCK